jgi:hypothetical protein
VSAGINWSFDISNLDLSLVGLFEAAKPFCDPWSADSAIEPVWHGEILCTECPAMCATAECAESECPATEGAVAYPHYTNRGPRDFLRTPPATHLKQGETAEVLLGIRQRLGEQPFAGTAFDDDACICEASSEHEFIAEVRDTAELAATASDEMPCAEACDLQASSEEASAPPAPHDASIIPLLRLISRNLEQSANMLEDSEMYFRADQLREMASELRLEARTAGKAWSLEPLGQVSKTYAPQPERDLHQENEELRAELDRLRESLRASNEGMQLKR